MSLSKSTKERLKFSLDFQMRNTFRQNYMEMDSTPINCTESWKLVHISSRLVSEECLFQSKKMSDIDSIWSWSDKLFHHLIGKGLQSWQ